MGSQVQVWLIPSLAQGKGVAAVQGRAEAWTVGPGGMDLEGLPLPPPQVPQGATMHFKAPLAWVALPLAEGRVAKRKAWGVGGGPSSRIWSRSDGVPVGVET